MQTLKTHQNVITFQAVPFLKQSSKISSSNKIPLLSNRKYFSNKVDLLKGIESTKKKKSIHKTILFISISIVNFNFLLVLGKKKRILWWSYGKRNETQKTFFFFSLFTWTEAYALVWFVDTQEEKCFFFLI